MNKCVVLLAKHHPVVQFYGQFQTLQSNVFSSTTTPSGTSVPAGDAVTRVRSLFSLESVRALCLLPDSELLNREPLRKECVAELLDGLTHAQTLFRRPTSGTLLREGGASRTNVEWNPVELRQRLTHHLRQLSQRTVSLRLLSSCSTTEEGIRSEDKRVLSIDTTAYTFHADYVAECSMDSEGQVTIESLIRRLPAQTEAFHHHFQLIPCDCRLLGLSDLLLSTILDTSTTSLAWLLPLVLLPRNNKDSTTAIANNEKLAVLCQQNAVEFLVSIPAHGIDYHEQTAAVNRIKQLVENPRLGLLGPINQRIELHGRSWFGWLQRKWKGGDPTSSSVSWSAMASSVLVMGVASSTATALYYYNRITSTDPSHWRQLWGKTGSALVNALWCNTETMWRLMMSDVSELRSLVREWWSHWVVSQSWLHTSLTPLLAASHPPPPTAV